MRFVKLGRLMSKGLVLGASEDGTTIYLVAQGVLADKQEGIRTTGVGEHE